MSYIFMNFLIKLWKLLSIFVWNLSRKVVLNRFFFMIRLFFYEILFKYWIIIVLKLRCVKHVVIWFILITFSETIPHSGMVLFIIDQFHGKMTKHFITIFALLRQKLPRCFKNRLVLQVLIFLNLLLLSNLLWPYLFFLISDLKFYMYNKLNFISFLCMWLALKFYIKLNS